MSSHIGQVSEFNEEVECWGDYVERLQQYFIVNEVTEAVSLLFTHSMALKTGINIEKN